MKGSGQSSVILGRDGMLLVLTWAAGAVDAVSYYGLGRVFTAMMTGNTVLLGLALAQGELLAAVRSILALLGFALGVTLCAIVVEHDESETEWPQVVTAAFAVEAAVLLVFAGLWFWSGPSRTPDTVHGLIVLLGTAMGIQAAAVRRLDVPGIATTYITGTITSLFVDVVGWCRSPAHMWHGPSGDTVKWEQRVGLLAGIFLVYAFGAFCGGVLQRYYPALVSIAPVMAVGFVVLNAAIRYGAPRF